MSAVPISPSFQSPEVARVFASYPRPLRDCLLDLRAVIYETAASTEGVGPIEEALRWGQPSYQTSETRSGTPVRIGPVRGAPDRYGLYVHCQTTLVSQYREALGDALTFDKQRGVLFRLGDTLPEGPVSVCVAMALRYHIDRSRGH